MPRTTTEVTVFLASPSDVSHERDVIVREIAEWNARYGKDHSISFDVLRWETSVSASFGRDGQDVINSQIVDNYDVLIGVFWARFGSPTPRASSGTVEEYHRALARYKQEADVDIAILFKDAPINFRVSDIDQLKNLQEFEKDVQTAGGLTKFFKDDDGLKLEIGMILDRIARNISRNGSIRGTLSTINNHVVNQPTQTDDTVSDFSDDDIGLFDIIEEIQDHAKAAGQFLDKMTTALYEMSHVTGSVASDFQAIRDVQPLEPSDTKLGIRRVAESMDKFSFLLEQDLPSYAENLNALGNDARNMVRVSYDWIDSDESMLSHLFSYRTTLSTMHGVIGNTQNNISEMLQTTSSMQRTTKEFNRAKRRMIQNSKSLIDVNESGRAIIALALDELGRLIIAVEQHQGRKGENA